jgi:hypothetical protein
MQHSLYLRHAVVLNSDLPQLGEDTAELLTHARVGISQLPSFRDGNLSQLAIVLRPILMRSWSTRSIRMIH